MKRTPTPHDASVRDKLIAAGVRNLKEFGYPSVDSKHILTDYVYSAFFLKMLEECPAPQAKLLIDEITKLQSERKSE